jgi:hypothetical protein
MTIHGYVNPDGSGKGNWHSRSHGGHATAARRRNEEYRVVRVPGRTNIESAGCDNDSCDWEFYGEESIVEGRRHTLETGHDTVVWATKAAWYSRKGGAS